MSFDDQFNMLLDEYAVRHIAAAYCDAANRLSAREAAATYAPGNKAAARWIVTELQVALSGDRRFIIGRYEDELVRLDEGWRFARRAFTARYLGDADLSGGVIPDIPVLVDFEL